MRIDVNNCAIIERTGDGTRVGRCWFYLKEKATGRFFCERHGDVTDARATFSETGKLTVENINHLDRTK